MSKIEAYREQLRQLEDWEPFLLQESGLPGPRGNLELAQAVTEEGDQERFESFLSFDAIEAPPNSPQEFLVFSISIYFNPYLLQVIRPVRVNFRRLPWPGALSISSAASRIEARF
jgi:hypothetical protein